MKQETLVNDLQNQFGDKLLHIQQIDCVTIELTRENLVTVCQELRDAPQFKFDMLIDLCGVDYLDYGISQWRTETTTATGFSRAVDDDLPRLVEWDKPRFAVVYHLLSLKNNQRLRIKLYLDHDDLVLPSIMPIWDSANWYEREAFDLFGFEFDGHPDLRRLLTDYGFKGHPFRKDFPLIGELELRYDAASARCVYEPVSIQPRSTVPKVIRNDNRYKMLHKHKGEGDA